MMWGKTREQQTWRSQIRWEWDSDHSQISDSLSSNLIRGAGAVSLCCHWACESGLGMMSNEA